MLRWDETSTIKEQSHFSTPENTEMLRKVRRTRLEDQPLIFFKSFLKTQLVLVRSIEKMVIHVYYYAFLILFLANFTSAILHRQNELQNAFGDLFGTDFG